MKDLKLKPTTLGGKDLKLKPTTMEDKNKILKLMNQKSVRKASFNTKRISKKDNENYWKKKLKSKDFEAFSGFISKELVCLVRIEKNLVSIAVDEKWREQGIAFNALNSLNLKGCTAEIKPSNTISLSLFKKLGFKETEGPKTKDRIVLKKE